MPFLPLVLAAAALSPPGINPATIDFPGTALREDQSAAALVAISMDQHGRVISCETRAVEGDPATANQLCAVAAKRRQIPARWTDGTPADGQIVTLLKLTVPNTREGNRIADLRQAPDLEWTVNRLPNEAWNAQITVALAVDSTGRVTDCGAGRGETLAKLISAVCADTSRFGTFPVQTIAGKPIPYVTQRIVRLVRAN
jgi:hypothetical protein